MKKSLFLSVALAAIVSGCSYDEVIDQQSPQAIGFGDQFINNAVHSRQAVDPSLTTESLSNFKVWTFNNSFEALLMDGYTVTKSDGIWKYGVTQYWEKGYYTFVAVAPTGKDQNVVVTPAQITHENYVSIQGADKLIQSIQLKNNDGTIDLIADAHERDNTQLTKPDNIHAVQDYSQVNFSFKHLLSKVKFTFKNNFAKSEEYKLVIKNIQIHAQNNGTFTFADKPSPDGEWTVGSWELQPGELVPISFGNIDTMIEEGFSAESQYERLLIPASAETRYLVNFDVVVHRKTKYEKTFTHNMKNVNLGAFELGKSYNINVTLDAGNVNPDEAMHPIEFGVTAVEGWTTGNDSVNPVEE